MTLTSGADKKASIPMEKTLLRVDETAELLSVSRWTVYRWVEEGRSCGTKKRKGSLRIIRESIMEMIEQNENEYLVCPECRVFVAPWNDSSFVQPTQAPVNIRM